MKITIETIPHEKQRYPTVGDYWWEPDGSLQIRVSDAGSWKYEALIALHEMIEVLLCKDRNIREEDITAFDVAFENSRVIIAQSVAYDWKMVSGPAEDAEPGDDPKAPYAKEHRFSENLERLFAAELGVRWDDYAKTLCEIWRPKKSSSAPAACAEPKAGLSDPAAVCSP